MLQTRWSLLLPLLLFFVLGMSLHADAYQASPEEAYDMEEVAYGPGPGPVYCPCSVPEIDPAAETQPQLEAQPEPEPEPAASAEQPPDIKPTEAILPEPLHYQVNAGDTLFQIAENFGVSLSSLMALNDIADPRLLAVGQQLQIPDAEAAIPLPDGQRKSIKQVLSSTLTAYTAGLESTGKSETHPDFGITYSGLKAEEGRTIAVDPSVIPIGSLVYIDGVGIRTAEDTGSAVRGARIDVFMNDVGQALDFGVKRNVKVYVLSGESV